MGYDSRAALVGSLTPSAAVDGCRGAAYSAASQRDRSRVIESFRAPAWRASPRRGFLRSGTSTMGLLAQATDYTDKDFDSLRLRPQSLVGSGFPDWTDFNVASFGTILLELFAFVGDVLTQYQDNQARESRLLTSTQRQEPDRAHQAARVPTGRGSGCDRRGGVRGGRRAGRRRRVSRRHARADRLGHRAGRVPYFSVAP